MKRSYNECKHVMFLLYFGSRETIFPSPIDFIDPDVSSVVMLFRRLLECL